MNCFWMTSHSDSTSNIGIRRVERKREYTEKIEQLEKEIAQLEYMLNCIIEKLKILSYKEKVLLNKISISCIDLLSYDSYIDQKQLDAEGETITTKIKNLFKQYIEKEDGE